MGIFSKTDHLEKLSDQELADWFYRAANEALKTQVSGQPSLAGEFLKKYLDNRNPNFVYKLEARDYLKNFPKVKSEIEFHRDVFLTLKKGRFGKGKGNASYKWAGILPRYQKKLGYKPWLPGTDLSMEYESLIEIGSGITDIIRIQNTGSKIEKDLFASLRGFPLKSEITLSGKMNAKGKLDVIFKSWHCSISDTYDFAGSEHLTLPNPDYGQNFPGVVQPGEEKLTVYHKQTNRLISVNLAAPYKIKFNKWQIIDPKIIGKITIDPNKKI